MDLVLGRFITPPDEQRIPSLIDTQTAGVVFGDSRRGEPCGQGSVGGKALCRVYSYPQSGSEKTLLENYSGVSFTASSFEASPVLQDELSKLTESEGAGFHVGGTWVIPASFNHGWTMEIRKHTFDPETVSVPIGTTTPG